MEASALGEGADPATIRGQPGEGLGLERVIRRLVAEDGARGEDEAREWIHDYQQFLGEVAREPGAPVRPRTPGADLVWQRHLLDTARYIDDCAEWLGGYLHRRRSPEGRPVAVPGPRIAMSGRALGRLRDEDLSWLIGTVRRSLARKPVPSSWIEEGRALMNQRPELVVDEYRRFLALVLRGGRVSVPSKLIDECWHQHILESEAYLAFCERVAGRYLHHRPHYERSHASHRPGFEVTKQRYARQFGEPPNPRVWGHLGESAGCGSEPEPLFKEEGGKVRARLTCGGVDGRYYDELHPAFAESGMGEEMWTALLSDVDRLSNMGIGEVWRHERRTGGPPIDHRFAGGIALAALGVGVVWILGSGWPKSVGGLLFVLAILAGLFGGSLWFFLHSYPRPSEVRQVVDKHARILGPLGFELRRSGDREVEVVLRVGTGAS